MDNIWGGNLLIYNSSVNSIKKYVFYYMVLVFIVYMHGLFLWKIKNKTITKTFQKIMKDSNFKPRKLWVDKSSEFFSSSIKSWLRRTNIEIYSTHNEIKLAVVERYIRTSKNNIW